MFYKCILVSGIFFSLFELKGRISHIIMEKMQNLVFPLGYLLLVLLPVACLGMATAKNITTDYYALMALKDSVTSDAYQILSRNWSDSASVCKWVGVTCDPRHRRVTALNVSHMGLSGTIPPQLGNLSFLASLDISRNDFHGELADELSGLRRLKVLDFGANSLSGEIPSWIGSLHELQVLYMRNNTFTGLIPASISNLSNLERMWLSGNHLQGSIPKGIGNLQNLNLLVIEHNQISGAVPRELFNISSLEVLSFWDNSLSGSLPMSICNNIRELRWLSFSGNKLNGKMPSSLSQCSKLQMLDLSSNEFGGFIPKGIGELKQLQRLFLGGNNLESGEIPREIGNLTMLRILSLRDSNLSGVIPRELGNLYNLQKLIFYNNSLSGSIPFELFNLSALIWLQLSLNNLSGNLPSNMCIDFPNLEGLYLVKNNLQGVFPESISNCSNLQEIELRLNQFVGSIPTSLGNLRQLQWLNIGKNHFTSNSPSLELGFITALTNCKNLSTLEVDNNPLGGYLPESVGNLSTSLKKFSAYNCNLKGKIPQGIGNLSGLIMLDLTENKLTGSVPETIENLQPLQVLLLGTNELNGAMMNKLCGLPNLMALNLSHNHISEPILECLGNVTSLQHLLLGSNRLASTIPANLMNLRDLLELNLSSNSLFGSLPPEVGNLKVAALVDLSVNFLSGSIPSTVGDLQTLEYLSLAFNTFEGVIPDSLGKLISLETLDLSHNNLSGAIPMTLEKLRYLNYLNVSFNDLSGEIPSGGAFQSLTSESFLFNKALCGAERFHVPPCPEASHHKGTRRKMVLVVLAILLGLAAFLGVIAFICIRCLGKGKVPAPGIMNSSPVAPQERFSYYNLERATDEFSESNLLGKGTFGSVYRGTIEGRIFAVKVFNADLQVAFNSFDRECEMLRNLRHRNLTKVVGNCSTPDFKALIFEFMPNGSLDKWLYSHNYCLDIMQRLNIMIDVACALDYLHSGYLTPVVHCDLKPGNILLDQDMVAHVTDFGISKFLSQENGVTYTNTMATFGYVAPEFGLGGLVSPKSDVYSYGIMMIEVFTRTNPSDEMFGGDLNLRSWVKDSMSNGSTQVIDANVLSTDEVYFNQKMKCLNLIIDVALNCTKESPRERCNIKDVLAALEKIKLQLSKCWRKEA